MRRQSRHKQSVHVAKDELPYETCPHTTAVTVCHEASNCARRKCCAVGRKELRSRRIRSTSADREQVASLGRQPQPFTAYASLPTAVLCRSALLYHKNTCNGRTIGLSCKLSPFLAPSDSSSGICSKTIGTFKGPLPSFYSFLTITGANSPIPAL